MTRWMAAPLSLVATLLALATTPMWPLPPVAIAVTPPRLDRFGDPLPPEAIARLGTVRWRHGSPVECLAYSADGRFLATGSWNGEVRLWDAATGKLVRAFGNASNHIIQAVALSPDGRLLATEKGELALWDVATGQKRLVIQQRQPGLLTALAFSPDGRALAVCTNQSPQVWLHDTTTGQPRRNFAGHVTGTCDAAFSRDGRTLVTGGLDRTVRVWNVATGRELRRFDFPRLVTEVALSPGGDLLGVGQPATVRLLEVTTGRLVHEFKQNFGHPEVVSERFFSRRLAFAPDGRLLAMGGGVWDVSTGRQVARLPGTKGCVFAPDGKAVACASFDHCVRLCDPRTGQELPSSRASPNRGSPRGAAFSPDGRRVATWGDGKSSLIVWDPASQAPVANPVDADAALMRGAAWSPDGKLLATAAPRDQVSIWDVTTLRRLRRLTAATPGQTDGQIYRLAFSPDGRTIALGGTGPSIRLWDVATGRELHELRGTAAIQWLQFGPDGRSLLAVDQDHAARLWDPATGQELRPARTQTGDVLAATADGRRLAVGEATGPSVSVLRLVDAATGEELRQWPGPLGRCAAFSPDGRTLAVEGSGLVPPDHYGEVVLLEVAGGAVRLRLPGHRGQLTAVTFSPDGRRLVTASSDTTALVWDVTGPARGPRPAPTAAELPALWDDLTGADATCAYRALWRLAAAPDLTASFLRERLRPIPPPDGPALARLIADLHDLRTTVRDRASLQLGKLGRSAAPALRTALTSATDPEVRRRLERLLARAEATDEPEAVQVRAARCVELLEHLGTPEARDLLIRLAAGDPTARLTREARATRDRLGATLKD